MAETTPPLPAGFSFADEPSQTDKSAPPLPAGFSFADETPAPAPKAATPPPDDIPAGATGPLPGFQAHPDVPMQTSLWPDMAKEAVLGATGAKPIAAIAGGAKDAAGLIGSGLQKVFSPTEAEVRSGSSSGAREGITGTMTPQEQTAAKAQSIKGLTQVIAGGGTVALAIDAPYILQTGAAAFGGDLVAQVAMAKLIGGFTLGAGAEAVAGPLANKFNFTPEAKELLQTVAFFTPTLFGAMKMKEGFGLDKSGNPAYGTATPGQGIRGGVVQTPEAYDIRAGVGGPTGPSVGVRIPRRGAPVPAPALPEAGQVSTANTAKAATSTMEQAAAVSKAAEDMVNGVPPPPPPGEAPPPAGMDQATITPKVVSDMAQVIQTAPEAMRPQLALEAHGKLAAWMAKTGKFIGPDGKLQIVDTPQKAATLAQQLINDEVDRHGKMAEQQAKDAEVAQKEQQKQVEKQQKEQEKQAKEQQKAAKEADKAAQETNENGLTPAEVQAARAKTIIETSDSPEEASANIMRSLRVPREVAQQLIQQHQQETVQAQGNPVGGKAEPTLEETPATVDAQMESLKKGTIKAVMLPEGSNYTPQIPPNFRKITVTGKNMPGAGTYIYDPTQVRAETIKAAAKAGTHGDLLGHIETKEDLSDEAPNVVVQARSADGTVVQDSQVHDNPETIQAQAQVLAERHPEAEISVVPVEKVLAERAQNTEPPLPEGYTEVQSNEGDNLADKSEPAAGVSIAHPAATKSKLDLELDAIEARRAAGKPHKESSEGWKVAHPKEWREAEIHSRVKDAIAAIPEKPSYPYPPSYQEKTAQLAKTFEISSDQAEEMLQNYDGRNAKHAQDLLEEFRKDAMEFSTKDTDANLLKALSSMEGAPTRWINHAKRPMSDEDLTAAIKYEFGRHETTDYKTTENSFVPRYGGHAPIKGKELLEDVRRLLEIEKPEPAANAVAKPEPEDEDSAPYDIDNGALAHAARRNSERDKAEKQLEINKGDTVTAKDKTGIDRTGTVAHAGRLVTRIKTEAGEITVKNRDVKPAKQAPPSPDEPVTFTIKSLQTGKSKELTLPGRTVPIEDGRDAISKFLSNYDEDWYQSAIRNLEAQDGGHIPGFEELRDQYAKYLRTEKSVDMSTKDFARSIAHATGPNRIASAPDEAQNSDNVNQSQPAASEPGSDIAGRGRETSDSGEPDSKSVAKVPETDVQEPRGKGDIGAGDSESGSELRKGAAPVPGGGAGSGSGEGSSSELDNAPGRDVAKAAVKAAAKVPKLNNNWYTHPDNWQAPAGEMGKLDANMRALRILRDYEKSPRKLTEDEKTALANYVGWGSLSNVFKYYSSYDNQPTTRRFQEANKELQKLLSPDEIAAARRSTQNAHYTSPELVRYMWDVMKQFGFTGGNVMEPSMGAGNFFGMMPKAMRAKTTALGNELDPITYGIAKLLYPDATLFNKDFVELILPNNSVDLAISNVPFGVKVYDPKLPKLNAGIHDYFFVKSLDKVRPGGVVAFITSTGTMDKGESRIRDIIASKADLIGAIRLPSGAFAKNAGTAVTTDILFLQKRAPGQEPKGPSWMKAMDTEVPGKYGSSTVKLNEYFHDRPEMMLGKPAQNEMYGRDGGFALEPHEGQKLEDLLEKAKKALPKGIMLDSGHPTGVDQASTSAAFATTGQVEGQYIIDANGNLKQVVDGKLVSPPAVENVDGTKSLTKMTRLKEMVSVRDKLNELLATMTDVSDDEEGNSQVAKQREALKKDYEKFVKNNGLLNSVANKIFEDDPHYPRLLALENYDRAKKTGTPADILQKRTIFPRQPLTTVSSDPKDALYQVLAERGFPDVNLMARLQGTDPKAVAEGLVKEGLIFRSPSTGEYEMKEKYLSGYVRDKLDDAVAAVKQGLKEYEPNVAALEKVLPADIPIKDIEVKLGATWIPLPAFSDFISEIFKSPGHVTNTGGTWNVSNLRQTAEVMSEYGTPDAAADTIMQASLNQKEMQITRKDSDGNSYVDLAATLLARQQQQKIRDAFNDWASKSEQWGPTLQKAYNYAYNSLVLPEYDGSHLTFPGMNASVDLRIHQRNVIWRNIQDGRALIAHVVGAGKTYEMAGTIMEGRRVGSFRKPMLAVPNHLVDQWRGEFLHLYPGASLLVPTPNDFDSKNRQRLMAKIATGDYDAVIMAHSQFDLMDISAERQEKTMQAQLEELEETIRALKADRSGQDARTVKQMEKSKDQLRTRMAKLKDLKADKAINFDETGVDALFIDEAHRYKNLAFYTKMTRVAGLSQGDSKRAVRLKMKTEYLQDTRSGRGVFFATGTPIQNTMAEQYAMTKFVAPDALERAGIKFFDDWAANFGTVQTKNELSADGRSFKARTKFSRFANVPELMNMFRSFTDIQTAKMLNLPTPKLEGGKPEANYVNPTDELIDFVASLVRRAENIKSVDPKIDNMLKIVSDGRKAALDMRLVHPEAKDNPDSKINQVVADVLGKWKEGKADKTTQLVFLDMYRRLPGEKFKAPEMEEGENRVEYHARLEDLRAKHNEASEEGLNLYDDMTSKWVRAGIPKEQIAQIGDYDTDVKKQKLFAAVNSGEIRILMGSTEKMGAGMNVQKKLKYLHHVDLPWRPGDLAQRNGRIERQGNENKEVGIKFWLTQKSFDTYMLQALESKARFIEQLMSGNFTGRSIEDIDSTVSMNLQDMKIATSGNPDVKKKYDLEMERSQLETLKRAHEGQLRNNAYSAQNSRSRAARAEGELVAAKKSLAKYKESRGKDNDGFALNLDGKKFTDRKEATEMLDKMAVPTGNFHLELNGVGASVKTFDEARNKAILDYTFEYSGDEHSPPEQTMSSLIRSMESRLRDLSDRTEWLADVISTETKKAEKLETMTTSQFKDADRLAAVKKEMDEVDIRLGIKQGPPKDEVSADIDDGGSDEDGEDENNPESGFIAVGALPGVQTLGKFITEDVKPFATALAKGGAAVGKSLVQTLAPRAVANLDALDSMMKLKGELEKKETELEYGMKAIKKMADAMTEPERIEFIDNKKTGGKQATKELQQIADMYTAADVDMHHAVVEAQIGNMDAASQKLWDKLAAPDKAQFWREIETGHQITAGATVNERKKLQEIADHTLKFKENHFRVFWKEIPGSVANPVGTPKSTSMGGRRPIQGDKGFMKQATLNDISEGIARGGVPVTTNFQKLFELGTMSTLRYITAQKMWGALKDLGLRKFVRTGETRPEGWVQIDDKIATVYFPAASGEGMVKAGEWYVEPSSARLLNNYLSRDLVRETAIGKGIMAFKNVSTAVELGLSPFHFVFETLEAMGSQFGLGTLTAWNNGVRGGSLDQVLKGMGLMAKAPLAPFTMARTGGSAIKSIENLKDFLATSRGKAFVKSFGSPQNVAGLIDDYFTGGGTLHMPREYRADTVQAMREAWSKDNYIGAMLRSPFAAATWIMKPLFETYIPRLKLGLFLEQYGQQLVQNHAALQSGDMSRAELARKTVDTVENRFGELNFSNLFWDNTFKSTMQTIFRSVTWKLGNWRGAVVAAGPELIESFADPLRAMREDWAAGKKQRPAGEYLPKMGQNQAWIMGMIFLTAILGTIVAKLKSGKYPWEYLGEDKDKGMSAPGALALEMTHPRIGSDDDYTKLPNRLTLPTGIRDFEHAARDLPGYAKGSLSGTVSHLIDSMQNRDFFQNYVYDPNGTAYQKMAELFAYNAPQPITVSTFREGKKAGDMTNFKLGLMGMAKATKDYDLSKAEMRMRDLKRAKHTPLTPKQVEAYHEKDAEGIRRPTAKEIRKAIKEGKMDYAEKLFHGMTYPEMKDIYDHYATPDERRTLRPMLDSKRSNLLKQGKTQYIRDAATK